ncbi:LysR family transcriptional regulator [Ferrimonas lipolytica]|uniref:LysR family transcriptional regulator n=1 Tax=Ferrimonas lipolytica TaxID=2724191 RepID=A0A6H1UIK2_9GAMM|nr:LysR family transcriptional regulator [Ferrimonas lipolytica]QIZ77622.1 LysR family transcriptional regulator [Ferrimonas lipolytica]
MRITLKQLAVLKAICEHGQISKAAKHLHQSVPAVSMSLKELESSLEAKLFVRSASGVVLNESGQVALTYANTILGQVSELKQRFQDQATGEGGTLNIGANKTCGNYVISKQLPYFKRYNPAINTRLKIGTSSTIEQMVVDNELDLAFISARPTSIGIESQPWLSDRLCVVASPEHKLAKRTASIEDLSAATWVLDEEEAASRIEALHLLKELGVTVQDEMVMNTMGAIKRAVGTGLGLSVLPLLAVDAELERGDLREVIAPGAGSEKRSIYLIYKSERLTPLAQRFIEHCGIELAK